MVQTLSSEKTSEAAALGELSEEAGLNLVRQGEGREKVTPGERAA